MNTLEIYNYIIKRLSDYTDATITELLLAEKRNPGWTNTRAIFLTALRQVAKSRGISKKGC